MNKISLAVALLVGLAQAIDTLTGYEFYSNCTDFQCFKENNMEFSLINAYYSLGKSPQYAIDNINNANGVNLAFIDVSFYPCRSKELKPQL